MAPSAFAAGIIYEPFSGYIDGDINGQTAQGTGLAGGWSSNIEGTPATGNPASVATVSAAGGLTFSSMTVTGGAVTVSVTATNAENPGAQYLGLGIGTANFGTITGTLYASYIYRANTGYTAANHAIHGRVSSIINGLNTNARFQINPDNTTTGLVASANYWNSTSNGTGPAPVVATTYLNIGRITNVGMAGGGSITMVTLTEAQYVDWLTNQGGDEALLFARTQGDGVDQARVFRSASSGTQQDFVGGTGTFLQTFTSSNASGPAFSVTYDEFKYATEFGDLNLVPEPSSLALASLAAFGFFRRRR